MREESEGDQPAGLFWQIAIPAVLLLVLAAHFVWPAFLPLKLVAIGLVVTLLSIPVQALHAAIVAGNLLVGSLRGLGVQAAFDRAEADLSGITHDPQWLVVDDVFHKARVRVDEQSSKPPRLRP